MTNNRKVQNIDVLQMPSKIRLFSIDEKVGHKVREMQKPTASGVPRRSPIQVLTRPNVA